MSYTKIEIESWDKQQNGKVEDHDGSSHAHENRNCAASSKRKAIVRSNDDQHVADNAADSRKYIDQWSMDITTYYEKILKIFSSISFFHIVQFLCTDSG